MGSEWWSGDWMAWRVFVKTLFGVRLTDPAEIAIFRECTGLDEQPEGIQREAWIPVGRRGGKSRILAFIAVYLASCFNWWQFLARGERGYISILAAFRPQSQTIMGYVAAAFLGHPKLRQLMVKNPGAEAIELQGSVIIQIATASFRAVRSPTTIAALCDEIAFWQTEDNSANPDREIIDALKPSMLTIPNSMLFGASSPYARRGVLWNAYDNHYGEKHEPGAPLVWKAPTWIMHPSVDRAEIDKKFKEDPISASAEYGAEFRSDLAAFVDPAIVAAAINRGIAVVAPVRGIQYVAFSDPSGGQRDSMTLAIAHEGRDGGAILDCLVEHQVPFKPDLVVAEDAAVLHNYGVRQVTGDRYAGVWPTEEFAKHGITYNISELSKSDIYREFLPHLNSAKVGLLDSQRLIDQLCGLERRTARGGRDSIDHPPNSYDDLINAAAGALTIILLREQDPGGWHRLARQAPAQREMRGA